MPFPGQAPDKKNSMLSAIGLDKPSSQPQAPSSMRDRMNSSGGSSRSGSQNFGGSSQPSSQSQSSQSQPGTGAGASPLPGAGGAEGKVSQDEAGYIPAGQVCGGCTNYTKETGDCMKVEGQFQAHDSCKTMYQAANQQQQTGGGLGDLESMTSPSSSPSSSGDLNGLQLR